MKKAKVSRSSMQQKDTVDESDNNVDAECFYCNEMYSKSSENDGWIQCSKCMRWAHEACFGCNEEDDSFICVICSNGECVKNAQAMADCGDGRIGTTNPMLQLPLNKWPEDLFRLDVNFAWDSDMRRNEPIGGADDEGILPGGLHDNGFKPFFWSRRNIK
ncbi:unnamed protein product [Clavelina lepadiformis]|uniref:Zinc finger PHD-type domain-containing protein n=1 Tax=Clavelina lepadiformis TaxID=159417 RepID=A0ABP0GLB8_CLALP